MTRPRGYGLTDPPRGSAMEAVEIAAVVAATWGVLMALSPILQIRRIIEQGSSEDVSLGYFWVLTLGFSLWLLYGLLDRQWPLIVPNAVALVVSVITMAVAVHFRRRRVADAVVRG